MVIISPFYKQVKIGRVRQINTLMYYYCNSVHSGFKQSARQADDMQAPEPVPQTHSHTFVSLATGRIWTSVSSSGFYSEHKYFRQFMCLKMSPTLPEILCEGVYCQEKKPKYGK